MKEIIALILLTVPTVWELWDDRNGDFNKKIDVWIRGALIVVFSMFAFLISLRNIVGCMALSAGIHFMFFDYGIAYILGHVKDWFSYLGEKGFVDNISFWKGMKPKYRFVVRLVVFVFSIMLYLFL